MTGSVSLFEIYKFISVAVLNSPLGKKIRTDIQNTPQFLFRPGEHVQIHVKFFLCVSENQGAFPF